MATLTQLLNGAKQQDNTIQDIIPCTGVIVADGVESYAAIRAGVDQYTKTIEYFQILVKDKGLPGEQAWYVDKCPCTHTIVAPTEFEQWLDDAIATEMAADPTIEKVIKEYVDTVQQRAQLMVIKNGPTGFKRILAFVYTTKDGVHKIQYDVI